MEGIQGIATTAGVLGALAALLILLVKELRINRQNTVEQMNRELADSKAALVQVQTECGLLRSQNVECDRRVAILIHACQTAGIPIPMSVWDRKPQ